MNDLARVKKNQISVDSGSIQLPLCNTVHNNMQSQHFCISACAFMYTSCHYADYKEQVLNYAGDPIGAVKYSSWQSLNPSSTALLSVNTRQRLDWYVAGSLESRKKRSHAWHFLSEDLSPNDHSAACTSDHSCMRMFVRTWTRDAQKWSNSAINAEDRWEMRDRASVNGQKQVPMTSTRNRSVLHLMYNLRKTKGKLTSSSKKKKLLTFM